MSRSSGHDKLAEAIAAVSVDLSETGVELVCNALRELRTHEGRSSIASVVSSQARSLVDAMVDRWNTECPEASQESVSIALQAAAKVDEIHRKRQSVQIVWSGPAPSETTVRRTDQVLLEMIRNSVEEIVIVTFTAYEVPILREAVKEALERGVRVSLILESDKESGGKVSFDPLVAFGPMLAERAQVFCWPVEKRETNERNKYGALHVKCSIADRNTILISSANITGHAFELNMELGLLVKGGDVPIKVAEHFEGLIRAGVLVAQS